MAFLTLNKAKLKENFEFLRSTFQENDVSWGVVSKLLCGNRLFLQELINLGVKEIHDSRISNLAMVKSLNPEIQTVYIKPVSKRNISKMVQFADVSLNSELETIRWISQEAVEQEKKHKIIIMVETGDLREGVMGEQLVEFYSQIFHLPNIEVIGLGTNLNCLNGVMPSADKLIQLSLYKQIIELKFNKKIPWVSAGTSVTIPLMLTHQLPKGINHFRVGETLYFGLDLFEEKVIEGMNGDVFELHAEIIEMQEKPLLPVGNLASNPQGETAEIDESLYGKSSFRAIIDLGLLDVDPKYLLPSDDKYEILGGSSDMLIINLGENPNGYQVGDTLNFDMKYMGALSLLNSNYIDKKVIDTLD
ncbi:alanine/ornithine racemase family PLP-dependent enzyme [Algoriphagus halophytocola]|uniref:Alanine/ornithine racemase family PLP-dependent enzyme n=1 Tax=Algoriphagus halophytocola TaxID=2991499 RepID=A0ABY6MM40_9BACT|nr:MULTISPECIES: alanine/ornithine racemase family PLP-dependent enzyme [unclassified Algoriphagus]UZD24604.1 alanine/ornithine racemase family PLP-dependent enzyme [Algoriphagus sp. TR-M5]WBL41972.1 alanine/ornithine racemase family PLP-dependent enzyme [Algoriphagus sp. TR-M9]